MMSDDAIEDDDDYEDRCRKLEDRAFDDEQDSLDWRDTPLKLVDDPGTVPGSAPLADPPAPARRLYVHQSVTLYMGTSATMEIVNPRYTAAQVMQRMKDQTLYPQWNGGRYEVVDYHSIDVDNPPHPPIVAFIMETPLDADDFSNAIIG
jgi:hypothetical protein